MSIDRQRVVAFANRVALACSILFLSCVFALPTTAQSVADFYTGKQMTIIVSTDPGGGYDALARLMARHLGRFLPGHPSSIVQNMPGAGSILASNHIYNVAPKDGTVLGVVQRTILSAQLTKQPGVRFDIQKFNWVGNLAAETAISVSWHTAPVKTAQELLRQELIVGGTGASGDSETTARLLNAFIGAKFKIVSGYPGSTDVVLAMERGEVQGVADWSWSNIKTRKSDYLHDNKINLLLQGALEKAADLQNVPLALDFARDDNARKVMQLYFAQEAVARPVMAGPSIPAERVTALRRAFMDMAQDSQFREDAVKSKLEGDPTSGESVDKVVAMIAATSPEVAQQLTDAINPASKR